MNAVAVALGGAVGATLRYLASETISARFRGAFPFHTLFVNVTGAFLLGLLMAFVVERGIVGHWWRLFLAVGVLGGYTTFSTFAFETLELMQEGAFASALANAAGSVLAGVLAAAAGLYIGRILALG